MLLKVRAAAEAVPAQGRASVEEAREADQDLAAAVCRAGEVRVAAVERDLVRVVQAAAEVYGKPARAAAREAEEFLEEDLPEAQGAEDPPAGRGPAAEGSATGPGCTRDLAELAGEQVRGPVQAAEPARAREPAQVVEQVVAVFPEQVGVEQVVAVLPEHVGVGQVVAVFPEQPVERARLEGVAKLAANRASG